MTKFFIHKAGFHMNYDELKDLRKKDCKRRIFVLKLTEEMMKTINAFVMKAKKNMILSNL